MVRSFCRPGRHFARSTQPIRRPGRPAAAGLVVALVVFVLRYSDPWLALFPLAAVRLLVPGVSDPQRDVPPVALGIVSPVDGEVVEVEKTDRCVVQGEAHRVRIRVDVFGHVHGAQPDRRQVMDLHSSAEGVGPECPANALWVETDEGDNVVLQFHGYRLGLAPKSFVRTGRARRPGAPLRLPSAGTLCRVYLPIDGKVLVNLGQRVIAGTDLIGAVPAPIVAN